MPPPSQVPTDSHYGTLWKVMPRLRCPQGAPQRDGQYNGHGHDIEHEEELEQGVLGTDRLWEFRTTTLYRVRWLPTLVGHALSYGQAWCQRLRNAVSTALELHEPRTPTFEYIPFTACL